MKTFNEIYRLREHYVKIPDINKTSAWNAIYEVTGKDKDFANKLKFITCKPNWEFLVKTDLCKNVYDVMEVFRHWDQYLIISENEPVGLLMTEVEYKENEITEIALLGLKENNITLVKDTLNLMKEFKEKYTMITWTVENDNPIKRAYDKLISKLGGESFTMGDDITQYTIVGDGLIDENI